MKKIESKTIMKYRTMIISVSLIVIALLLSVVRSDNGVKFGRGNGKNAKISTTQELESLFDFLSGSQKKHSELKGAQKGFSLSMDSMVPAVDTADDPSDQYESDKTLYTGVTAHENSYINATYHMAQSGIMKMEMNRRLSVYMTEDASYYRSAGNLLCKVSAPSTISEKKTFYYIDFDIEFYTDASTTLFRFNQWDIVGDMGFKFSENIFHQWISFPEATANELSGMDLLNRDAFWNLRAMITFANSNHLFEQNGETYTVKPDSANECLRQGFGVDVSDDTRCDFSLDLSDSENPILEFSYHTSGLASVYADLQYSFENINNTRTPELKKGIKILKLTEENIKNYIIET